MIKNLIFIFSLFILSSCSKTPEITYISNIEMSGIEGDTIKAQSVVTISNPNLYSISLDNVIMNFCYDSVIIGKGIVDEKIRLKKSNTDVLVNSNISIKELYKTMPKVFETDSFQLTINVLAELSFFKININRKIKTYINTKQIINSFLSQENIENNISINSISVSSIGYDSTELFFNIKVVNFLPFSYVINKIKVDIYNDTWHTNSAGFHHSVDYGFGLIIYTAVALNKDAIFSDYNLLLKSSIVIFTGIFILGWIYHFFTKKRMSKKMAVSQNLMLTMKSSGFAIATSLALFGEQASIPASILSVFVLIFLIYKGFVHKS